MRQQNDGGRIQDGQTFSSSAVRDLLYLASCAVNGNVPSTERIAEMDLGEVYKIAKQHMITAVAAYALELAGVQNAAFAQARVKAIRKTAIMDAEQAKILAQLEKDGIWYMPMKGAVLKDLYPSYGIRQMSDRDILVDADRMEDIRVIMEGLGFTTEHFGSIYHDCYKKPPVCNFEMHRSLFEPGSRTVFSEYYSDVKKRLLKDEGNRYGWHFSPEDFYIYMIGHEYKHYSSRGTGFRSVLDTYVYLKSVQLDEKYIAVETEKMGLLEFEQSNRMLAMHLFKNGLLSESDQKILGYIAASGVYGNEKHRTENELNRLGRKGYFRSRLTAPYYVMLDLYPILKKAPMVYPFCWAHRLLHAFIFKNRKVMYQLKAGLIGKRK